MTNRHPIAPHGEFPSMTRRALIATAALVASASLLTATGCANSSSNDSARSQLVSQDAAAQIAQLQAEDARRLREALALGEQGDKAFAKERYAEAVQHYSQAVSTYDEFFALWNNLGTALFRLDRYQQAEEAFIRASNINPSDPRPLYNRGLLYRNRGYPDDAKMYFERALEQDPRYLDALWGTIKADITLGTESRQTLERIRTALFMVTDEQQRRYLELERERIAGKLGLSEGETRRDTSENSPE